jgi:hypothetical protein
VLYALVLSNTRAAFEGLLFGASYFSRTPKSGLLPSAQAS